MQAVRLKLAGGQPKVVPPDEAQCVWRQGANTKACAHTECGAEGKPAHLPTIMQTELWSSIGGMKKIPHCPVVSVILLTIRMKKN